MKFRLLIFFLIAVVFSACAPINTQPDVQAENCNMKWEILSDRRSICDENMKIRWCTPDNDGEVIAVEGQYNYMCVDSGVWVSGCNEYEALYPGSYFDGIAGDWYICDNDGLLQCNRDKVGELSSSNKYECSLARYGWIHAENNDKCDDVNRCKLCSEIYGACENDGLHFQGWNGLNREILWGEKIGECNSGTCDYSRCGIDITASDNVPLCYPGVTDVDHDEVLDQDPKGGQSYDHEPNSQLGCEVYNYNNYPTIEQLGKQVDPNCVSPCEDSPGATGGVDGPLNLHIIITPCNFGSAQYMFNTYADILSDKLINSLEPFKSNTDKFRITRIWENHQAYRDQEDGILKCEVNEDELSRKKCLVEPHKTIFMQLISDDGLFGGCGVSYSDEQKRFGECNLHVNYLDINKGYTRYVTHEIGHALKLGHSYYTDAYAVQTQKYEQSSYATESRDINTPNDFYVPDIPFKINPLTDTFKLNSCPIWDFPEYTKWVIGNEEEINCYPFYDAYVGQYRPWLSNDLMAYEWNPSIQKLNPVARKVINDALNGEGYQKYINTLYPHRCSEIDDEFLATFDEPPAETAEQMRNTCLVKECHLIPLDHTDNSGIYYFEGMPYNDYLNYMGLKTGLPASTSRDACCNQITNDEAKKADCLA